MSQWDELYRGWPRSQVERMSMLLARLFPFDPKIRDQTLENILDAMDYRLPSISEMNQALRDYIEDGRRRRPLDDYHRELSRVLGVPTWRATGGRPSSRDRVHWIRFGGRVIYPSAPSSEDLETNEMSEKLRAKITEAMGVPGFVFESRPPETIRELRPDEYNVLKPERTGDADEDYDATYDPIRGLNVNRRERDGRSLD